LQIGKLIKTISVYMERDMNRDLAQFDLTAAQGMVLGFLSRHQGEEVCQRNIEQDFNLSHPTMSSILKRMESKGLIITTPLSKDRRYKKVSLSEKGKDLDNRIYACIEHHEEKMRAGLSEKQQEELISLLNIVIQNISA